MPHTINVGARSFFVTATAWVFIVLGLSATASAVVQNAHLSSLLPALQPSGATLPLLSGLLMEYLQWVLLAALVMSVAMLASAIGLLMRLDWARRVFIGVLAVAIAANLTGLWLQHELVQSVFASTLARDAMPPQLLDLFGSLVTAARVMAALMTLSVCLVMAWIIHALSARHIRQEFA